MIGREWWRAIGRSTSAILLLSVLGSPPADAADRWTALTTTVFRNYGRDQGLPHPVPTALAQDRDGFIWIGTQGGLARWDGYRFKAYKADRSVPGSLPDDWIQTLHVDRSGRLWIGTNSGRLARYAPVRDQFIPVNLGLRPDQIHVGAIANDRGSGLWIGTDDGLRHLDPTTGVVRVLRPGMPDGRGLPAGRVQAVIVDQAGTLWVGTANGLARQTLGARIFVPVPLGGISALFDGADGRIWIGTTRDGLYVIDRPGEAPRPIGADQHLPPSAISAIAASGPHEIWAAFRDSGIMAVDTRTGTVSMIRHDRAVPSSLAHNDIWALLRDNAGSMWEGGTGGLGYRPAQPGLISTVFGAQDRPNGLSASDVISVLPTHDGHVWLGYLNGGADVIDPSRGRVAALRPDAHQSDRSLPRETMFSMVEGKDGRVYLGTRRGLYVSDLSARSVRLMTLKARDPHLATNALLYDAGILWIAGEYDGVWGVSPGDAPGAQPRIVFGPSDSAKLSNPDATVLIRGPERSLWVGTRNGLNRIDLANHHVEAILPDQADPHGLPGGYVSSLRVDRKGRLWVGTFGGGLAMVTGRDARGRLRFRHFDLRDRLPHLNVDSLAIVGAGTIWAGTDDGLARIDPDSLTIRAFGPADGAPLRDFFTGASAATAAGEAIFGAKDGIAIIRPGQLPEWHFEPRIVITDLRVGGSSMPVAPYNEAPDTSQIVLTPATNSIAVEFAALDFTAPEHNRYAYRLDGLDTDWVQSDPTRRLAAYNNLPPGDYTLRLRGSNRNGVWEERALPLHIRVLPAWYQTLWFRCGVVILLGVAIVAIVRRRTLYLQRRQIELEQQITERTADLQVANQRLAELATIDQLTGCFNRRHFAERAKELIPLAARHGLPLTLAILDLDDFKLVNDTWGHPAGDAVLMTVGRIISDHVRTTDVVGRIGGEEFAVLMPHTSAQAAELLADRLREAISEAITETDTADIRTTASFGVAELMEGEGYDSLYARADSALYTAKKSGRNRVALCV